MPKNPKPVSVKDWQTEHGLGGSKSAYRLANNNRLLVPNRIHAAVHKTRVVTVKPAEINGKNNDVYRIIIHSFLHLLAK